MWRISWSRSEPVASPNCCRIGGCVRSLICDCSQHGITALTLALGTDNALASWTVGTPCSAFSCARCAYRWSASVR